jgi:hypothetical protein
MQKMDRFPAELDDLLNARGRRLLRDAPQLEALLAKKRTPIIVLDGIMDDGVARECIEILDEAMYPHLKRMHTPIPRTALTEMKRNYAEQLPKTVRVKTVTFNTSRSRAHEAARQCGLASLMWSKSFLHLAQRTSAPKLRSDFWGAQVICYENGDYSGPHNDHHPEREETRNGFLDLHVMFSNEGVASQSLVYEERGFLSAIRDVTSRAAIAVYRLPFWHYTTPLVARPGHESTARRWLLLGSFDYDPPLGKLEY